MTAVPFDWIPRATLEPERQGTVVRDEGDVGDAQDADEPRRRARRLESRLSTAREHVAVVEVR